MLIRRVCSIKIINYRDLELGELAIFCGAGISKNSGISLANELKLSILKKLHLTPDEINKFMDSKIPFESFMEIISEATDASKILEIFEQGQPNKNHLLIAKLAKLGIVKTIITTNFDVLIEKALIQEGLKENLDFKRYFTEDQFNSIKSIYSDEKIRLIKIHGTIDDKNSIRATLKIIANQKLSKERFKVIDNLFYSGSHDRVLVMGYSCSDIFDISPQIEKIQNSLKEIIYIEHSSNQRKEIIEDVKFKKDLNPFKNFFGYNISINNNKIVDEIWESYDFGNYKAIDPCFEWQSYVDEWSNQFRGDEGFKYFVTAGLVSEISYFKRAINYSQKSLTIAKEKRDIEGIYSCYNRLGILYGHLEDFKTALNYHLNALEISKETEYRKGQIMSYSNIGVAYGNLGEFKKSIEYLNKVITEYDDIIDPIHESQCYGNIGVAYQQLYEFNKAIEFHSKSLKLNQITGNIMGELVAYNNIGTISHRKGGYEKAIEYYQIALEISQQLDHKEGILNSYFNLYNVYNHIGNPTKSQEYHHKMLEIVENSDIPIKEKVYSSLGEFEKSNGNYKKAMRYFKRLINISIENGNSMSEALCYKDMGFLYFQLENYEKSLEYYIKAEEILKKNKHNYYLKLIYEDLSIVYELLGDNTASKNYHEKSMEL